MNRKIIKITNTAIICILLLVLPLALKAQRPNTKFRAVNRAVSIDKDSKVVRLNKVDGIGIAWILNEEFTTGEIEFDIKGIDLYQGSFLGLAFHGVDDKNYEAVYFRPFNFRAADPLRKSHAVQYMSNPNFDWPVLRERFPGKYEKRMPSDVDPNWWFHVKLIISTESLDVYINRSKVSVLTIRPLLQVHGKMIGYWVGTGSSGEWKNLTIKR